MWDSTAATIGEKVASMITSELGIMEYNHINGKKNLKLVVTIN
jgi:hypothetical protein